tara:strand:+ start:264 stop:464 length:201 start_codon:yes stop_codon:yes gene_type:complete
MQDLKIILDKIDKDLELIDNFISQNLLSKKENDASKTKSLNSEQINNIIQNLDELDNIINDLNENS